MSKIAVWWNTRTAVNMLLTATTKIYNRRVYYIPREIRSSSRYQVFHIYGWYHNRGFINHQLSRLKISIYLSYDTEWNIDAFVSVPLILIFK